jgi:hypothetical protein
MRMAWSGDPDPVVASAGWALTTLLTVDEHHLPARTYR